MNYLDLIIAVPLLYGLVKGFSNGLIKEVTWNESFGAAFLSKKILENHEFLSKELLFLLLLF